MTSQDIFTTELEGKRREGARPVAGHLPGAVNLPLMELVGREDEIRPNTLLTRASWNRSFQAKMAWMNPSGGMAGWIREGRDPNRGEQP